MSLQTSSRYVGAGLVGVGLAAMLWWPRHEEAVGGVAEPAKPMERPRRGLEGDAGADQPDERRSLPAPDLPVDVVTASPVDTIDFATHAAHGAKTWSGVADRLDDLDLDIAEAARDLSARCARPATLDAAGRERLVADEVQLAGYLEHSHPGDIVLAPAARQMRTEAEALAGASSPQAAVP